MDFLDSNAFCSPPSSWESFLHLPGAGWELQSQLSGFPDFFFLPNGRNQEAGGREALLPPISTRLWVARPRAGVRNFIAAPSTVTAPRSPGARRQAGYSRAGVAPSPPPATRFSSLSKDNTKTLKSASGSRFTTSGQLRPARTGLRSPHRNTSAQCTPKVEAGTEWAKPGSTSHGTQDQDPMRACPRCHPH